MDPYSKEYNTGPHDQSKGQGEGVWSLLPGPGQLSKV